MVNIFPNDDSPTRSGMKVLWSLTANMKLARLDASSSWMEYNQGPFILRLSSMLASCAVICRN